MSATREGETQSRSREIPRRRDGVRVVTLLHPQELVDEDLPAAEHDQRVDAVVTVDGITWLRR